MLGRYIYVFNSKYVKPSKQMDIFRYSVYKASETFEWKIGMLGRISELPVLGDRMKVRCFTLKLSFHSHLKDFFI